MKMFFLIVSVFLAIIIHTYKTETIQSETIQFKLHKSEQSQLEAYKASPSYKCDGRQHCSQMTSREEAEFFIKNCPKTKMDGDRDGIPCENHSTF